jgi:nicotinate dehydrogenase subunit A
MTAKALVDRTPNPTDAQIRQAMSTVLCRCAAHQRIFAAIKRYAQQRGRGVPAAHTCAVGCEGRTA